MKLWTSNRHWSLFLLGCEAV